MIPQLVGPAIISVLVAFALSAAGAAITGISRVRAQELYDEGRAGARFLITVVADRPNYLAVIAFLRIVAEAITAVLVTLAVAGIVKDTRATFLYAVAIMSVVSLLVVGFSPRLLSRSNFDAMALFGAPVAVGLRKVLGPISRVLIWLGNPVSEGLAPRGDRYSEAELRDLVDQAGDSDVIEDDEREMIHSVFELGDTVARGVMVPRTDMITIEADRKLSSALSLFLRSGYSRIPVVGDDSDDVLGLLYFRDVVRRLTADPEDVSDPVRHAMRPMHFVPESKPIDDLLREMQLDQTHFAIVVDEYGGTAGLVTIEDILEEIVGEITDEYDREAPPVEDLGDGRWRVKAGLSLDDVAELFDLELEDDDVDTIGGLLAKATGRVPIVGSTAEVDGLRLTADQMSGRRHRIATLIVERAVPGEDNDENGRPSTGEN